MGSQPIRIQLGKILQENPVGNSYGKILQENLTGKSCGKFLQENLVGNSFRKFLQEILVGNLAEKVLMVCIGSKNGKKPPTYTIFGTCGKFLSPLQLLKHYQTISIL